MASSVRRNTFVISEMPSGPMIPSQVSGMDRQNLMRLKVNRIALVQELKVEHILGALMKHGIISELDLRKIESGRTPQDRARILIDLLPTKSKDSEWYKCFREALLNPEGGNNLKHRYRDLVEFLDNTMIHRPTSQAGKFSDVESRANKANYPRYQPLPQINEKQSETNVLRLDEDGGERPPPPPRDMLSVNMDLEKMSMSSMEGHRPMMLVKGFFHQWIPTPDNFKSLIEFPKDLRQALEETCTPEANTQLRQERAALHYLRRLEVISALARRRQLPSGFELCMCDAVQEFLAQPHLYHLYLKHLRTLQAAEVNIAKDIFSSYLSTLEMVAVDVGSDLHRQVVDMGFRFSHLLVVLEMWSMAREVISSIIALLKANPAMETWINEYKAQVKLMGICNDSYDLRAAQKAYYSAAQLTFQIQMMSFGQKLLFEGRLHQELSSLMLEYGSIQSAYSWSRKALQELDPEDHSSVVEVVTHAVFTHCALWQVKKAETLAIFAVQFALDKFGKYHPLYLKALSSLCHVCNEFKQDSTGVQLANELLRTAELVYGCDTLQLASAHRTLSKALMANSAFRIDNNYYDHAMEAVRIARSQLPEGHALLHPYLTNFALALQWKSLHCPKEVQESTLHWAETEAKHALNIVMEHYGDISLRSAQIHTLLGQIYSKMNEKRPSMEQEPMVAAERHLSQAVEYLQLCQPTASHYLLLAHATLATFLTMMARPTQAIPHLKQVLMYVESTGFYLKWVHVCFQTLINLLQTEGAAYANVEEAGRLQVQLSLWLKDNPKDDCPVDTTELSKAPPLFKDFMDKFDAWGSALLKVQSLKDSMKPADLLTKLVKA